MIRASRQSQELFGANPLFRPFDHLGRLNDALTGEAFSLQVPLSGQILQGVEVELNCEGRQLHLLLSARPLIRRKEILGCVLTLTDITERKQAETTLREAKVAAEEANRAKSEFLANMSHEIRTPMTVFLAVLEHLLQIDRNPERRHLLEMADQSAKHLRALIDDILDFSRIEAKRVEIEEAPIDLRDCLKATVDMFALSAREKNLRLEMEVAPETPVIIFGDSGKLGQVLTNLIGNAIKFTSAGEVRLSVQPKGESLEFAVSDTGIGIPKEKRHLLFESFTQVDSSFQRQYGGSGLGLAISKGLVDLMGGGISVQSRQGGGSIFIFTLPLKRAQKKISEQSAAPRAGVSESSPAAHILLAEDQPLVRELIARMLLLRGWEPEVAKTGREALEKWEKGDFDILLMDLQMPEMDGLEATRAIRAKEVLRSKHTCIFGFTAHARSEIVDECLKAGMDNVITKPVKMADLYSAIDDWLRR